MKLEEGIKKEDLWGGRLKVKGGKELDDTIRALKGLGYVMKGLMPPYDSPIDGYLLCYTDSVFSYYEFITLEYAPHWPVKSLSDLVEEEKTNFVKCIDVNNLLVDHIDEGGVYLLAKEDGLHYYIGESGYFKKRFVPATEEEYLAYQASLNPLKQVDDEWDKMKKDFPKNGKVLDSEATFVSRGEKTFAISDDQIKYAVDKLIEYGYIESVLMEKLKEWFPAASVFKKDEETYKTGQRFYIEDFGNFILAQVDANVINFVSLENGNRFGDSVKVEDIDCISQEELYKISYFKNKEFTLIS